MPFIEDNLGRRSEIAQNSMQEVKSMLQSLLQGKMGPATKYTPSEGGKDTAKTFEKIEKLLDELVENNQEDLDEAKEFYKKAENWHKQKIKSQSGSEQRNSGGGFNFGKIFMSLTKATNRNNIFEQSTHKVLKSALKDSSKIETAITTLTKHATKKGSIYTHDETVKKAVEEAANRIVETLKNGHSPKDLEGVIADTGSPANAAGSPAKGGSGGILKGALLGAGIASQIGSQLLSGDSASVLEKVWNGIVAEQLSYIRDMKKIAFQTDGITSSQKALQDEWMKTGKVVAQTGINLGEFQHIYVNLLKKGVRSREEEVKVLKTGANLSTMIGSNTADTTAWAHQMSNQFGMSNNQIAEMSRGIQQIAVTTGVTGDELMQVVRSSEQFIKNLRNAGTLTASAANNFTKIQAIAQKIGIADEAQRFSAAMSSSADLYLHSAESTKALLFQAAAATGRIADLSNGTIGQSRKGIADMGKGLEEVLARFGTSFEQLDNLNPEQLRNLNLALESAYGIQANQLKLLHKTYVDGSKSFAEQSAEISKEMANTNLTTKEKIALEQKQQKLTTNKGLEFMTAFDEAAKTGISMTEAVQKATAKLGKDMDDDLKAMGVDISDPIKKLEGVAQITAKKIKEAGGADLSPQIQKAIDGGDTGKVRELLEQMNTEQQKLGVDQVKKLDPLEEVGQKIALMNETLRSFTTPALSALLALVSSNAIIAMHVGGLLASSFEVGGVLRGVKNGIGAMTKKDGSPKGTIANISGAVTDKLSGNPTGGFRENPLDKKERALKIKNVLAEKLLLLKEKAQVKQKDWINHQEKKGIIEQIKDKVATVASGAAQKANGGDKTTNAAASAVSGNVENLGSASKVLSNSFKEAEEGLKGLNKINVGNILKLLAKGAMVLLILTPAIVLLATALIWTSKQIIGLFGMKSEEAAQIAGDVASVIWSASKIAMAVLVAAGGLAVLGLASSAILEAVPTMFFGALALMALAPAIVAVASAVVFITSLVMKLIGVDAKVAEETASAVSTVLWSAAKIAMATALAAVAMFGLAAALPTIWAIIPIMMAGSKALAILAPAVVALAASTLYITKKVMSTLGIDAKEAEATSEAVSTILMSAAKITIGTALAAAAMVGLAAALPQLWWMIPSMFLGGAALMALAPAVIFLAAAMIQICKSAIKNFDVGSETVKATVDSVKTLISGAGDIAGTIIWAAAKLATLGLLSGIATVVSGLMTAGAIALMILAEPVMALSIAIMAFGNGISSMFPSNTVKTTVDDIKTLIDGANDIAGQIISQIPFYSTLGSLSFLAPWIAATLWLGVMAFAILAPPISALVLSIISISKKIAENLSPKVAKELMTAMDNVSRLISSIGTSMSTLLNVVTEMTTSGWFSSSPATKIAAGIPIIKSTLSAIAEFISAGVIDVLRTQFPIPQNIVVAANVMSRIAKLISNMGIAMKEMSENMVPLADGHWWKASPFEKIRNAIPETQATLSAIAEFISQSVIEVLKAQFPIPQNVVVAANVMNNIGKLIENMAITMSTMAEKLVPLLKPDHLFGDSKLEKISQATEPMKATLKSIADFISTSVIGVLMNDFPYPINLIVAANVVKAMSKVVEGMSTTMTVFMDKLYPLTRGSWFFGLGPSPISYLDAAKERIGGAFNAIALFIETGIMDPLLKVFPNPAALKFASKIMDVLVKIITGMKTVMLTMINVIGPMVQPRFFKDSPADKVLAIKDRFAKYFESISKWLKEGVIDPVNKVFGEGDFDTTTKKIQELIKVVKLIPVLVDSLGEKLGPLVDKKGENMMPIEKIAATTGTFGTFFKGLGNLLTEGIVNPIGQLPDSKKIEEAGKQLDSLANVLISLSKVMDTLGDIMSKMATKKFDGIDGVVGDINKMVSGLGQLNVKDANVGLGGSITSSMLPSTSSATLNAEESGMEAATNVAMTGKVGAASIPSIIRGTTGSSLNTTADVQSGPLMDAHKRVAQEQITKNEASYSGTNEMAKVAELTTEQVRLLALLHEDNQQIIELLTPRSAGSRNGKPSTVTQNKQPMAAADFGQWQFGKYQGNASRQVINDGMS